MSAPLADVVASRRRTIPDARLRLLPRRLHRLGERPLYELFREIISGGDPVDRLECDRREFMPDTVIAAAFLRALIA